MRSIAMNVCLSVHSHISNTTPLNFIFPARYLWPMLSPPNSNAIYYHTSGFGNDVMFAHNLLDESNANMAYSQIDSPGAAMGAKCDVYDHPVRTLQKSFKSIKI